jgi:hypothetical protein
VAEFVEDLSGFDPSRPHALVEYEERFGKDYLSGILRRYWIHLGGRALDTFRPVLRSQTLEHVLRDPAGSCARELGDTSHFHVDLFGNYIPGLCAGLAVACEDLGRPLAKETYPLLTRLFAKGIRGFYEMAAADFGYRPSREGYVGKCDLCTDIRRFLVSRRYDRSSELSPEGFYQEPFVGFRVPGHGPAVPDSDDHGPNPPLAGRPRNSAPAVGDDGDSSERHWKAAAGNPNRT